MKKLVKNIVLMLTALFLISMATSCKKKEPAPAINFNNPTAQYIESFLGKPVDEFIKACEESGMMKMNEKEGYIYYKSNINNNESSVDYTNNTINEIYYSNKGTKDERNKKTINYINYLKNNNYAGFHGITAFDGKEEQQICTNKIDEILTEINNNNPDAIIATFIKTSNGCQIYSYTRGGNGLDIIFSSPSGESYEDIKSYAMSSCN